MSTVNVNGKDVKEISVDLRFLPRKGLAQVRIDRNKTIEAIKVGQKFIVPFTATFKDYSTMTSKFEIVKMFKDSEGKDIIMVQEDSLGQFGVLFNSFMSGSFKNEFQVAYDRMLTNRNTYYNDYVNAERNVKEAKDIIKVRDREILKERLAHSETLDKLQRTEDTLEETKYTLVKVEQELTDVTSAFKQIMDRLGSIGETRRVAKDLLSLVRLATARGKSEADIELAIAKFLTKYFEE
jgi:hypothetical protein